MSKNVAPKDWHKSVCRPGISYAPVALSSYAAKNPSDTASPIDHYLTATETLLKRGDPTFFSTHPELGGLLLVGVISHAENYFRDVFARLLLVCPISQVKSAQRDMKLGSVIWHRSGRLERGAFEHFSFASSDNIIEILGRYFDVQLDQKSDPYALLQQFDLLCELRHAIVHSAGLVSGKNAMKLQLSRTKSNLCVNVDFQRFQDATGLCTALVCSMNIELFKRFGERWRDKWPKCVSGWNTRVARERFSDLWNVFASTIDQSKGLPSRPLSAAQCRREVLAP